MIAAGRLNRQIDILSRDTTKDSFGAPVFTYTTQVDHAFWADVQPISGTEYWKADQSMSELQYVFSIRYTTEITPDPTMKVSYNSEQYNIQAVINKDDANVRYDLICNRVAT
jgi:SPP1 family predicted phage head-tail adaptor